jgi:YggT family protein
VYSIPLQVLHVALEVFILTLVARFIMSFVLTTGRRWRPARSSAAALEVVWSVTDPPLKALRRVIPPLRLGTVSFDLSSILLFLILIVLQKIVAAFIS